MSPVTKEAIRNEFRVMLEEHDSGSCATSLDNTDSPGSLVSSPEKNSFQDLDLGVTFLGEFKNSDQPLQSFGTPSTAPNDLKCPICGLRVSVNQCHLVNDQQRFVLSCRFQHFTQNEKWFKKKQMK